MQKHMCILFFNTTIACFRYHAKKKLVKDLSDREHRRAKKKWREYARQYRSRRKASEESLPVTSPLSDTEINIPYPSNSGHATRGRKRVSINRSRCVRKNKLLQKKVSSLKRRLEKYKKRLQRFKNAQKEYENPNSVLTPKSKSYKQTEALKVNSPDAESVRKTLEFHNVLLNAMKKKYSEASRKERVVFARIVKSKIIKKYRFTRCASSMLGIAGNMRCAKRRIQNELTLKREVEKFFTEDHVSCATAGKRQTITRRKQKQQVRYLKDSMKNLYRQFIHNNNLVGKISYTTFTRCRPFFVLKPDEKKRNTCLCKLHSNMSFKTKKLHECGAIATSNLQDIISSMTCDKNSPQCMYGTCQNCSNKDMTLDINLSDEIFWWKWETEAKKNRSVLSQTKLRKGLSKL